ncbi:hypothetical protein FMEAI12_1980002 [Parafrankia sp. Ea1.12]|nr:hypothetical protein FMEAI12_1980002 [Parafrankia sp. Ea1.12]
MAALMWRVGSRVVTAYLPVDGLEPGGRRARGGGPPTGCRARRARPPDARCPMSDVRSRVIRW